MLSSLKKLILSLFALVVAMGFLTFAILNREVLLLNFAPLPYTVEMRLFLFMGVVLLIGIFLGWVVASFECRRRYLIHKDTHRRLTALEEENKSLRMRDQHLSPHSSVHDA